VCEECETKEHTCFHCQKRDGNTVQCSVPTCGKYYHWECVTNLPFTKTAEDDSSFRCPLHTCSTCLTSLTQCRHDEVVKCTRCPVAYHKGCIPPGSVILNDGCITCSKHLTKDNPYITP
jgi:hypothetical protein